jgi:hypothetical protein
MAQARPMTGAELDAFAAALEVLAAAFQDYRARTGGEAILVGGGAVIVHIGGAFFSGDFDIVAGDSAVMAACMAEQGFVAEDRPGRLRVGWYHPDHPLFGFQQVVAHFSTGALLPRWRSRSSCGTGCRSPCPRWRTSSPIASHSTRSPR